MKPDQAFLKEQSDLLDSLRKQIEEKCPNARHFIILLHNIGASQQSCASIEGNLQQFLDEMITQMFLRHGLEETKKAIAKSVVHLVLISSECADVFFEEHDRVTGKIKKQEILASEDVKEADKKRKDSSQN